MVSPADDSVASLADRIQVALDEDPNRPWCVHRLYEELLGGPDHDREGELLKAQFAADQLVGEHRAQSEAVSALTIGVHCQDTLYWSSRSPKRRLEEFGPEYESPLVLRRLASHFRCRGL